MIFMIKNGNCLAIYGGDEPTAKDQLDERKKKCGNITLAASIRYFWLVCFLFYCFTCWSIDDCYCVHFVSYGFAFVHSEYFI